jgi:polysaccharide export outer membrane protein
MLGVRLLYFGVLIFFISCRTSRSSIYFSGQRDTLLDATANFNEPLIHSNDILSIHISSLNQEASTLFNAPNNMATATTTTTGHQEAGGYLVDVSGEVQLPLLGKIHAAGMTKTELRERIIHDLKEKQLLLDPVVMIRHLNYEVTVVGEVGKPTVINIPNERISLLKALGMAGDITIYGLKDRVMLIREKDGKRQVKNLNLNEPGFLTSDFYYLQPGDIVYVEPNRHRVSSATGREQMISITLSALSFLAIILTQVFR